MCAHGFCPRTLEARELGREVAHAACGGVEVQVGRLRLFEESWEVRAEIVQAVRGRRQRDDVGFGEGVEDQVADKTAQCGEVCAHAVEKREPLTPGRAAE